MVTFNMGTTENAFLIRQFPQTRAQMLMCYVYILLLHAFLSRSYVQEVRYAGAKACHNKNSIYGCIHVPQ